MSCKITEKRYKCKRCGYISLQETNHYGETYSFGHFNCCPKCPPWAKFQEFGGTTVWECLEKPKDICGD
jgi:hypothetical protein